MKTADTADGGALPPPTASILENPVLDAERFASVLYKLIEDAIGSSHEAVTKHKCLYHLQQDDVDDLLFIAAKTEAATAHVSRLLQEVL